MMVPWYNGYGGEITMKNPTTFLSHGRFELDEDILIITELPVRTWTSTYKEFLESLMVPEEPKKADSEPDKTGDESEYDTESSWEYFTDSDSSS